MSDTMTLRKLLEYIKKQNDGSLEPAMDLPLNIGVHDCNQNFDYGIIFNGYPQYRPTKGIQVGEIRIDCSLSSRRLVKKPKDRS